MRFKTRGAARLAVLLVAVTGMLLGGAVNAHAALDPYGGGPVVTNSPMLVPNDHTALRVQFSASSADPVSQLSAETTYHVKVRLSPKTTPDGANNRGFVYNGATHKWIHNKSADWTAFPEVKTAADGSLPPTDMFFKFGDEQKSGKYYVIITLNPGADENSRNCTAPIEVSVLDMKTNGAKVHNAGVTGEAADKRISINPADASSSTDRVLSITRCETNLCDDDADGTVDNEDYGLSAGSTGDWSLAATSTTSVKIYYRTSGKGTMTTGNADEDIAFGAADQSAPSSPTALQAVASEKRVDLSWDASTDDNAVSAYNVYRWVNTAAADQTPVHQLIGTTAATTFADTSDAMKVNGVVYNYEVRAVDTSTNVSARSTTATTTSISTIPTIDSAVSGTVGYNGWYRGATNPLITLTTTATGFYVWDDPNGELTTYTAPVAMPQGVHTLYYLAVDEYGNESEMGEEALKYDASAPTLTLSAPAINTNTSANRFFRIFWRNSDAGSPSSLDFYEVECKVEDGSTFVFRTTSAYLNVYGVPGKSYSFRVRARDLAGNLSAWSATKSTAVTIDDSAFAYSGTWGKATATTSYMGSARYTTQAGASSARKFLGGKAVYLIAPKAPGRGLLKVYVDGVYVRTVSLNSATIANRVPIFLKTLTGTGYHTVKLVHTGTARVDVDGLAVLR